MKALYCDACGALVDPIEDGGLGTFQFYEKKVALVSLQASAQSGPEMVKKEVDLCLVCCKKLEGTLINIQQEVRNKQNEG